MKKRSIFLLSIYITECEVRYSQKPIPSNASECGVKAPNFLVPIMFQPQAPGERSTRNIIANMVEQANENFARPFQANGKGGEVVEKSFWNAQKPSTSECLQR